MALWTVTLWRCANGQRLGREVIEGIPAMTPQFARRLAIAKALEKAKADSSITFEPCRVEKLR